MAGLDLLLSQGAMHDDIIIFLPIKHFAIASSKPASSPLTLGSEDVEFPVAADFNTLVGLILGVFSNNGRFLYSTMQQ